MLLHCINCLIFVYTFMDKVFIPCYNKSIFARFDHIA